jgi:deazaflavin-dependent oxidoreductase (nitroreductase family)
MADENAWEEELIADIRAHGGRPSSGPLAGHPLLVMISTGARSGQPRRAILTYTRDGDDYIVAGTKNGAPTDPAWVGNIRAQPEVSLEIASETFQAIGSIAEGAERDRLWDHHVAELPWFADYPEKSGRVIPMISLRRKG